MVLHNNHLSHDRICRKAFDETLKLLGDRTKKTIIFDLELAGAYQRDSEYLELGKVNTILQRIFGEDTTQLLMEHALLKMDELCSETVLQRKLPI